MSSGNFHWTFLILHQLVMTDIWLYQPWQNFSQAGFDQNLDKSASTISRPSQSHH